MKDRFSIGLLLYLRPHLGGSGIISLELAKQLVKRKHDITLISYPDTFLTEQEKDLGLKLEKLDIIGYPCFKSEPFSETFTSLIADLAIKGRIDIVHANYAITHGLAGITAKNYLKLYGKSLKTVVTSHGSDIHTNGHHNLLGHSIQHILLEADDITFVSRSLKEQADSLFPLLGGKGKVIPNFVDREKFSFSESLRQNVRTSLNIPYNAKVVYHASNFRDIKNTLIFLDIAELDKHERDKMYFIMVGEGPDKEIMENELSQNDNLKDHFFFVGKQEDVVPYICASDVCALPSKREAFGLVLIEAMSCGIPAVGSRVGGIPEIISHGYNGYLFEEGDANEMHFYLRKILDSPVINEDFGRNSSDYVEKNFSLDRIVDEYEKVYEGLRSVNPR